MTIYFLFSKIFEYCIDNKSVYLVKSFDVAIYNALFIPIYPFLGKNKTGLELETDVFGGCGLFLQTKEFAGGRC